MSCVADAMCQCPLISVTAPQRADGQRAGPRDRGSSPAAIIAAFCNNICQKRTNAPQQNFLFDHRAERSGAHRTKNRRLCGARAKPPTEVAGPKSYSADLV